MLTAEYHMRVLLAFPILVLLAVPASAETIATGCVNNSNGAISRVRAFSANPSTPCPSGHTQMTFQAVDPGVSYLSRTVTFTEPGEKILFTRAPYTLVGISNDDGTMRLVMRIDPLALPIRELGPTGSLEIVEEEVELLTTDIEDIAGDATARQFVSQGFALLQIDNMQLTNVEALVQRAGVEARFSRPHFQAFLR